MSYVARIIGVFASSTLALAFFFTIIAVLSNGMNEPAFHWAGTIAPALWLNGIGLTLMTWVLD